MSALRFGREPIGITFSGRAADPRYDNKRTEMYFEPSIGSAAAAPRRSARRIRS